MKKIIYPMFLALILVFIIAIGLLDAKNLDNSVYQYLQIGPLSYYDLPIWDFFIASGTIVATITASIAAYFAFRTWELEKLPVVHAMGTFIISTDTNANKDRDFFIKKENSPHTLQLVNVGRGPAKNVIPSVGKTKEQEGRFLEAINPHSFSLPSNQGTKIFGETLRVHGRRFVQGDKHELEFENGRKTAYFYIHFKDYRGKHYLTKVKIRRVNQVDNQKLDKLIKDNKGIEVWKVMENINETN